MQVTIATGQTKVRQPLAATPVAKPKKRTKRPTKRQQQEQANWQTFISAARLHDLNPEEGTPLSWREFNRVLFAKWQVANGMFSDFPGQTQASGAANLLNYAWDDVKNQVRVVPVLTR